MNIWLLTKNILSMKLTKSLKLTSGFKTLDISKLTFCFYLTSAPPPLSKKKILYQFEKTISVHCQIHEGYTGFRDIDKLLGHEMNPIIQIAQSMHAAFSEQ